MGSKSCSAMSPKSFLWLVVTASTLYSTRGRLLRHGDEQQHLGQTTAEFCGVGVKSAHVKECGVGKYKRKPFCCVTTLSNNYDCYKDKQCEGRGKRFKITTTLFDTFCPALHGACDTADPNPSPKVADFGCGATKAITKAELHKVMKDEERKKFFSAIGDISFMIGGKPQDIYDGTYKGLLEVGFIADRKHDPWVEKNHNKYYDELVKAINDKGYLKTKWAGNEKVSMVGGDCAFWNGGIEVSIYARALGFITLEKTLAGCAYDEMNEVWGKCSKTIPAPWTRIGTLWNFLSKGYASTCKGEITMLTRAIDMQAVWATQEWPQLKDQKSQVKWVFLMGQNAPWMEMETPLVQTAGVTMADIDKLLNNEQILEEVVGCKDGGDDLLTGKKCDTMDHNAVAMHILKRQFEEIDQFCRIYFDVSLKREDIKEDGAAKLKEKTSKPNNWNEWLEKFEEMQKKKSYHDSQFPFLGLNIREITSGNPPGKILKDGGQTISAFPDAQNAIGPWKALCTGMLGSFYGVAKQLLVSHGVEIDKSPRDEDLGPKWWPLYEKFHAKNFAGPAPQPPALIPLDHKERPYTEACWRNGANGRPGCQ